MNIKEEKYLRSVIRSLIRESMFETLDATQYAGPREESEEPEETDDRDGKPGRESDQKVGRLKNRRSTVMNALKNKFVDCAPYAYALWPDKDEDNARSQFYKCRDGELNDSGSRYSFTDQEINRLFSMITNNQG